MPQQIIYQVDAFTDRPFSGNPAGVCVLKKPAKEEWMQHVAREMNLSETAFLVERKDGFDLRWFTPAVEVDMCGHATLASGHILYETGLLPGAGKARFHTKSGLLTAALTTEGIELDFPATPAEPCPIPDGMAAALNVPVSFMGKSRFDYLVLTDSEKTVRSLDPDMSILKKYGVRGVMVTAASDFPEYDFVSRFFAPGAGINEDPVTGSAHCCLGPFWGERLGTKSMRAFQSSARGGSLKVRLQGDRVLLTGKAVTVMHCELVIS
ncbi:PhzF family phenazine biosynthesis protein [bacterium]|nr:PhzF family phenazine biosynthesis protein [bacterium]